MVYKDKTYIIIVTFNGVEWLSKCMESTKNYVVIVVDNCSSDATVITIKKNYPEVILIEQTENLGFGQANNIGITYALKEGAEYVFLLNQDAYLQPDTVEKLIEVYNNNSEYGILSPIHLNGDASKLDKNFSNYIKANDALFCDALKGYFSKPIYEVPFVNAAAWLLPRKMLETIGGFDPIFYHYAEDDNYCQRVLYHGFKIGVVPNCYVLHDREFRPINNETNNSYNLILKERELKYKWANINIEVAEDIDSRKKYLKTLILKLFIKFKYKKMAYYKKELALINRVTPEVLKSRNINSKTGMHYLL